MRRRLPFSGSILALAITGMAPIAAVAETSVPAARASAGPAPAIWQEVGGWQRTRVVAAGGTIDVRLEDRALDLPREAIARWVDAAARAVVSTYGRYPVPKLRLEISIDSRSGVHHGVTYGGGLTRISLGAHSRQQDLDDDWVLTHEMHHLACPDLDESHLWLEEGLATWLEPPARVRVGTLDVERMWRDLLRDAPQGLPQRGDRGLDLTHTWGRTYWGGALFCLVADVRIRERSGGKQSLRDALVAILDAGGDARVHWDIERWLAVGDRALSAPVLAPLYQEMALHPGGVDLPALWRRLGVVARDGAVVFDDSAELSAVRTAMTATPATAAPAAR